MSLDIDKAEAFNCIAWILKNRIKNENSSPIEFEDHAFMIQPYMDNAERQAIMKCAQIGWSVMSILRSFHLARFAGANIIHTFPSRNISKDFVIPKVNPLMETNPAIKKLVDVDSLNLKSIITPYGKRFIYYRGSYEATEAISISAHILINDEFDRSNQKVLKAYRSRLDDAKRERPELGWEWRFSNPSIPGYGVDELWQKSDMKHWFVKCGRCNYDWYLTFADNINIETKEKVCAKCRHPFTRENLIKGRWVRKHRDRKISGYWVSQLFVPWITAEKIIENQETDPPDVFHNFTLGLPYVEKDASVTREALIKCISPGYNSQTNVAMGVDNGIVKTYVIGNREGIFRIGETKDWREIEKLRAAYNAVMVIDANPYPTVPKQLTEKYPGKAFIHYYVPDKNNSGTIKWDLADRSVKSDRVKIIDFVVAEINSADLKFNMKLRELDEYIFHWIQLYRQVEMNNIGIMLPKWKTIENRPDHFAHATILWRVALEKTLSQGGILRQSQPGDKDGRSQTVSVDQTIPALDLKKVLDRVEQNRNRKDWKSV